MSIQDAAAMIAVGDAKSRLMTDPSLTLWDKVKGIETIDRAVEFQPTPKPWVTPQQVFQGAIDAGLGLGVGAVAAKWLGVSDTTATVMKSLGAGLGTLFNTGAMKTGTEMKTAAEIKTAVETDLRNAVMLGYLEGARATGLIDHVGFCKTGHVKKAISVLADPSIITAPVSGLAAGSSAVFGAAGTGLGHVFGEDDTDEDIERTLVEKRLLDRQADKLRAQHHNQLLSKILSRRNQPKPQPKF
jgi:hypothetical protein